MTMKRLTTVFLFTAAMLIVPSHTTAQTVDPYTDGWVTHVTGSRLEICFSHAEPPAVGQIVQLLRTSYVMLNKGPTRQTFTPNGHARIASIATLPCVIATLLDGDAQRSDHARPPYPSSTQLR